MTRKEALLIAELNTNAAIEEGAYARVRAGDAGRTISAFDDERKPGLAAERYPQVLQQLDEQEKMLCVLSEHLMMLATRLEPVIRPQAETRGGANGMPGDSQFPMCGLAERIRHSNEAIVRLDRQVSLMMELLEV